MSFAQDTGYLPATIEDLMDIVMENVNTQFATAYTTETFLGTNFYKYFYALIQRLQENEIKTSEIFLRMQQYFDITNEMIVRPNTTNPGLLDYLAAAGYTASIKEPNNTDAGKAFICVLVDSPVPAATKTAICTIIKDCVVAGVVTQGDQVEDIALPNGQSFDFKFSLPNEIAIQLRLTQNISGNNQYTVPADSVIKQAIFDNVNARYRLGLDFEPQRYYSVADAPWAGSLTLEYSDDGGMTWEDDVYVAEFDDLFTFDLTDISIVTA